MSRALFTKTVDGATHPGSLFEIESPESSTAILDRLAGLCAGILADGVVSPSEADYFADWVRETTRLKPVWPLTEILKRVQRIYEDGRCDDEERQELKTVMESILGIEALEPPATPERGPDTSPFDSPAPDTLVFPGRVFALTGLFAFGTQSQIKREVESRGGKALELGPTESTDYLVVGVFATQEWESGAFGRDVDKAMELKEQGAKVAIVSEEALVRSIDPTSL